MPALIEVLSKARKHSPARPTGFYVDCKGVSKSGYGSIEIFKDTPAGITAGSSFSISDIAEYDSYNLSYTGEITKITDKCVTIVAYKGHKGMEATHRLDINSFCWRNFKFNAAETAARNAETSMYI